MKQIQSSPIPVIRILFIRAICWIALGFAIIIEILYWLADISHLWNVYVALGGFAGIILILSHPNLDRKTSIFLSLCASALLVFGTLIVLSDLYV